MACFSSFYVKMARLYDRVDSALLGDKIFLSALCKKDLEDETSSDLFGCRQMLRDC